MIAAWMLYSLAVGVLCAAAAWLAEGALRQRGVALRWVWVAALLTSSTLTATAPLRRTAPEGLAPLAGIVVTEAATAPPLASGSWLEGMLANVRRGGEMVRTVTVGAVARLDAMGATRAVALGWGGASAVLLLTFGAVLVRSHRLRRRWPEAEVAGVRVRVAPEAGPFVAGLVRAEIVVPAWLLDAPEAERALVLTHESEHVRAKDPALLLAACMVAALLPWHPAVWWMLSRLRLAVELDCDARVLKRGASRGSYGRLLLDLAGRRGAPLLAAPALMDSATHLERRIDAMTTKLPRFSLARSAALGGLAGLTLLAACEAKMPTAPEIERMDVAAAESQMARTGLFLSTGANTTYTLDGATITADQARALDATRIGSIEVQKQEVRSDNGAPITTTKVAISTPEAMAARGETVPAEGGRTRFVIKSDGTARDRDVTENFEGILVIDGVKADPSRLRSLPAEQIAKMEVIKGAAAEKLYDDPQAKNGVILITTKQGAKK